MESITELVNDHPFDMELQGVFLKYISDTSGKLELNAARALSSQFIDLEESHWIDWIESSRESSTADELAGLISMAFWDHPTPDVLAACIRALPTIVESDWNGWTIFSKRPSAEKSAIRFMEQALDKVSLWPNSRSAWTAAREFLGTLRNEKEGLRKLFLRELQAVPMSQETRNGLIAAQKAYEESAGLSHIAADVSGSEKSWASWSALEKAVEADPSLFYEMINKRTGTDTPETIASLYARSVVANRFDPEYWLRYSLYIRDSLKNENLRLHALRRSVKNCPYNGKLWLELIKAADSLSNEDCQRFITMGASALRDSLAGNEEALQLILLSDAKLKLKQDNTDLARESFSNAVSILSEVGPKFAVEGFLVWIYAETSVPLLRDADGSTLAAELLQDFMINPDWEDKRSACTPLQWVQIAWIKRNLVDHPGVREVYSLALKYLEERYWAIVLQDQALFEASAGSITDFIDLSHRVHALETSKRKVPDKISRLPSKKKPRQEESADMVDEPQVLAPTVSQKQVVEQAAKIFPKCVYIKDLAFSVNEEKLCEFFESVIGIKPVRTVIVKNSVGRSRGFGYAEFDSDEAAAKAVACTGQTIDSRSISVTISNRPISVKKKDVPPPAQVEEEKVKTNDYFRNLIAQKQKLSHR